MKTITVKTDVYKFDELSEESKQNAIENLWDISIDHEWWDYLYEDAANIGLKITGFDLDRADYCKGNFLLAANEVAQNIFNQHGQNCESYKTAQSFMDDWQPVFSSYMDENSLDYESRESENKLQEIEENFLNDLLEDYKTMLQKEYDFLTSEENIIEVIQINEYDFTIDGKLF